MTGINGGDVLTTGFAHNSVLSVASNVIDAVKAGKLKHIFLLVAVTEQNREEITIQTL